MYFLVIAGLLSSKSFEWKVDFNRL